jgi:asparagine synthetase B (glutamine-hydrolysing)
MCGIFGLVARRDAGLRKAEWANALERLFLLSETRGKEAAGIAIATGRDIIATKDSVSATEMMKTGEFAQVMSSADRWFADTANGPTLAAIGHSRLVTNGLQGIDANNQPVWRDDVIMIHNGIVVNVDELWDREKANGIFPSSQVDTEVIAALITKYRKSGDSPEVAISRVYHDIYGETSVALFLRDTASLHLATNTGSLYLCRNASNNALFFASEKLICERLVKGKDAIPGFSKYTIEQLRAGYGATINLETLETCTFGFGDGLLNSPSYAPLLATQRAIEDKASKIEAARRNIRRCTRCILPETMPFIAFDADGVCNYCNGHKPSVRASEDVLAEQLDRIRSKDGSPDCIVAFSGGRDSSYGLHLLKTKYGMTPLAYTYDWGMVTDLARRNQARLCGKLGVEHIWISADIKRKRANIRANVLAWLQKPDLGIIPLFMAGDKQFLWYANKMMKETGISHMVFCTNEHEKTDFKTGFLGVNNNSANVGKPSSASVSSKINLITSYGRRFASNPRYINKSIPDTAWAYISYYMIKQSYIQLFDYLPWLEHEVEGVLRDAYDWELNADTPSSWRIGDGTAAFYNHIYYTVCGFTEFDTFRSSQIRAGYLDREQALKLTERENQPRWSSIREYLQLIMVDFDDAARRIDRIPKLYMKEV